MGISIIGERYRLDHLLGEVNHSQFYEGYDTQNQSRVLIRLIDLDQHDKKFQPKLENFMQNEFRVMTRLVHPNVLQTLTYGLEARIYYQINEYVPFTTFHQYLLENQPLELETALKFVLEIADTLTHFHRIEIVHCDLKPENMLIHRNQIKLMEFSIANHMLEDNISTGTPPYMSPEAAMGVAPAPSRDIWSLGVILFEILSRQLPFQVDGRMDDPGAMPELLGKIVNDPVPNIEQIVPNLPPRLIALVKWMLEKDVSQRIGSVRQVASEIEIIIEQLQQSSKSLAVGEVINGRYRIQSVIGAGGFGQIFAGTDLETGIKIAVKKLKAELTQQAQQLERFKREIQILMRLDHPGIIKVLATVERGSDQYLIMPYADGGDLRVLLDKGRIAYKRAIRLAIGIADALARVHDQDIIHRDIKPENILLTGDGVTQLTDFGVSYIQGATRLTESKGIVGTFQYMAPEVLEGSPPSKLSDMWSFGILFYEMLTGNQPFLRTTLSQIIMAILTDPVPDISTYCHDCPGHISRLIMTLLERDPTERPTSMQDVLDILKSAGED